MVPIARKKNHIFVVKNIGKLLRNFDAMKHRTGTGCTAALQQYI